MGSASLAVLRKAYTPLVIWGKPFKFNRMGEPGQMPRRAEDWGSTGEQLPLCVQELMTEELRNRTMERNCRSNYVILIFADLKTIAYPTDLLFRNCGASDGRSPYNASFGSALTMLRLLVTRDLT
jgi:hypothetical protein